MAQSTAGIKLYYGTSADGTTIPPSWTEIPDITGIPSMGASPNKLDTTTLAQLTQKTYIDGLVDLGGTFEFTANMTPALIAAVDAAAAATTSPATRAFKVSYPSPIEAGYWWMGETQAVVPGEASPDAVITTTVYVSQETAITYVDETAVS
jgi:hypothetical protein